jgi:hypothetical protein
MDTANQAGKMSKDCVEDDLKDDLKEKVEACEEVEEEVEKEAEEEVLPDAVQLAVAAGGALLVGVLYLLLPERITLKGLPSLLPLLLEAALLAPSLVAVFLLNRRLPYRIARGLALTAMGVLTLVLAISVAEFILVLTQVLGGQTLEGSSLLQAGALLWVINILVFAVWYWEIDGGGPLMRLKALYLPADLLFPQQQQGNPTHWVPGFIDYLFVAFCFSTALSPADTAPLTRRAKALMMAQAAISLTIIVLLVGRSVNILPAPQ